MHLLYSAYMKDPRDVYFDGEDNDEKIILCLRRHLITNLKWILISILLFAVPPLVPSLLEFNEITIFESVGGEYAFVLMLFWYVFAFGYTLTSFLGWYFNAHLITNKRIVDIDFEGLIHRRFSEASLSNIEDLTHQISGALQVVFNYGTVHIQTAGELRELELEFIPKPARVQDTISDLAAVTRRPYKKDDN